MNPALILIIYTFAILSNLLPLLKRNNLKKFWVNWHSTLLGYFMFMFSVRIVSYIF